MFRITDLKGSEKTPAEHSESSVCTQDISDSNDILFKVPLHSPPNVVSLLHLDVGSSQCRKMYLQFDATMLF